jgi:hypothetical protein
MSLSLTSLTSLTSLSIQIPVTPNRLSTPRKKAPSLFSDDTKIGSWSDVIIDTMKTSTLKKT